MADRVSAKRTIDNYGLILLSIAVTYVLVSAITSGPARALVLVAQVWTVWLVFRVSESERTVRWAASALLLIAAATALTELIGVDDRTDETILFAAASLLYLISPLAIVRHVLSRKVVDLQTLLGAIAAYLLIGMFFAFAYRVAGNLDPSPFFGAAGDGTMSDDLFFSFTTLMTVGYGNVVPDTWVGQTMAVAEGLIGSLFLVVAVAKVVSSWRPRGESASGG